MSHIKKYFLILFLLLFPGIYWSFVIDSGGVRNIALGGTGIASSNDNSAALYNPALLSYQNNIQLQCDYAFLPWNLINDNISNGFVSISLPYRTFGTFAFSANFLNSNDFDKNFFGFQYAKIFFKNRFALGLSLYYLNYNYNKNIYTLNDPLFIENSFSKNIFNFEFGISFNLLKTMKLGLIYKNILDNDISLENNNSDRLPKIVGIGISYKIFKLLFSLDANYNFENITNNSQLQKKFGIEYKISNALFLRTGLNDNSFASGFGIKIFHKVKTQIYSNPISTEKIVNSTLINFTLDYAFRIPFNSIYSGYGDHYLGIKIDYSNSYIPQNKYKDIIPPKVKKVYYKKTFIDSLKRHNANIDTFLIKYKIKIDTVYIEKIKKDTIKIYSGISDTLYRRKVAELERTKLKLENVKRINLALIHLSNSMKFYYSKNFSKALKECQKAIRIAPGLSLSYIRLGSIYFKIGEFSKAKFYWKKAKKIDPKNPELKEIPKGFLE